MNKLFPNIWFKFNLKGLAISYFFCTLVLLSACAVKKTPSAVDMSKDNTTEHLYREDAGFVFEKIKDVLKNRFNFTFAFVDSQKRILSTNEVREQTVYGPVKYRINVSVSEDVQSGASVLRIYKQEKIFQNNKWEDKISNDVLEQSIFDALKQ